MRRGVGRRGRRGLLLGLQPATLLSIRALQGEGRDQRGGEDGCVWAWRLLNTVTCCLRMTADNSSSEEVP